LPPFTATIWPVRKRVVGCQELDDVREVGDVAEPDLAAWTCRYIPGTPGSTSRPAADPVPEIGCQHNQ
jgi:hypothetical protein